MYLVLYKTGIEWESLSESDAVSQYFPSPEPLQLACLTLLAPATAESALVLNYAIGTPLSRYCSGEKESEEQVPR